MRLLKKVRAKTNCFCIRANSVSQFKSSEGMEVVAEAVEVSDFGMEEEEGTVVTMVEREPMAEEVGVAVKMTYTFEKFPWCR